jgi:hypothetical protein
MVFVEYFAAVFGFVVADIDSARTIDCVVLFRNMYPF